jgi:hypothetical protein
LTRALVIGLGEFVSSMFAASGPGLRPDCSFLAEFAEMRLPLRPALRKIGGAARTAVREYVGLPQAALGVVE